MRWLLSLTLLEYQQLWSVDLLFSECSLFVLLCQLAQGLPHYIIFDPVIS